MGRATLIGLAASSLLLSLYFLIMFLSNSSFEIARDQLYSLRFWVIPLVLTFGIQIGMYSYLKLMFKQTSIKVTVASTATSTTAMIACCAHHLTDILPLIGLSILATFLIQYQKWFLGVGIISNLVGIIFLYNLIKKLKYA